MDDNAAKNLKNEEAEKPEDFLSSLRFTAKERAKNVLNFPVLVESEHDKKHSKTSTKTQQLDLNSIQDLQHERVQRQDGIQLSPEMWQKMVEELVTKLVESMQLDQVKQLQAKINELTIQVQMLKTEMAKNGMSVPVTSSPSAGTPQSAATPASPGEIKIKGALKLILQKHPDLKNDILLVGQDLEKLKISPKFKQHAQARIKSMLSKKPSSKADLIMLNQIIQQV